MSRLLKAACYAASALAALLITVFFLAALFDPGPGARLGSELAVVLASAALGYGLVGLSVYLGRVRHRWFAGLTVALAAPPLAGTALFVGLLTFGRVHWQ